MRSVVAIRPDDLAAIVPPIYRGARILARRERRWHGVAALHLELRADGPFEASMQRSATRLLFTVETSDGGRIIVTPDRQPAARYRGGPLSMVAAGMPVAIRGKVRHFRQLVLDFDRPTLARHHAGVDLAAAFRPRLMFADTAVSRLCQLLADECLHPAPMGDAFGDSLVHPLLLALTAGSHEATPAVGGLAAWQLRHLEDFVADRLGDDLSLDHLAQAVGVSRSHFGRVFKQTTGQSPFEWLRAKRIERAKELLADGEIPVAEVALATGFADQAHLTRVFGRAVGMPPGLWQRTRRRFRDGGLPAPLSIVSG
jgi:AraC-like DNA-binding protein